MKQKENQRNNMWISTKESLDLLRNSGLSITKMGLKYIGTIKKIGMRKKEDDFHYEYNKKDIEEYIFSVNIENIDRDKFKTIKEISEIRNMSLSTVYYIVNKFKLNFVYGNRGQIKYVNLEEFDEANR